MSFLCSGFLKETVAEALLARWRAASAETQTDRQICQGTLKEEVYYTDRQTHSFSHSLSLSSSHTHRQYTHTHTISFFSFLLYTTQPHQNTHWWSSYSFFLGGGLDTLQQDHALMLHVFCTNTSSAQRGTNTLASFFGFPGCCYKYCPNTYA